MVKKTSGEDEIVVWKKKKNREDGMRLIVVRGLKGGRDKNKQKHEQKKIKTKKLGPASKVFELSTLHSSSAYHSY